MSTVYPGPSTPSEPLHTPEPSLDHKPCEHRICTCGWDNRAREERDAQDRLDERRGK